MDKLSFTEGLGKKILMSQHDFFKDDKGSDLEHVTNIKRIIVAISDHLKSEDVPADGINAVGESLKEFSKDLFLSSCLLNKDDDEDEGEFMEDSENWFDYIYEHGEYPR